MRLRRMALLALVLASAAGMWGLQLQLTLSGEQAPVWSERDQGREVCKEQQDRPMVDPSSAFALARPRREAIASRGGRQRLAFAGMAHDVPTLIATLGQMAVLWGETGAENAFCIHLDRRLVEGWSSPIRLLVAQAFADYCHSLNRWAAQHVSRAKRRMLALDLLDELETRLAKEAPARSAVTCSHQYEWLARSPNAPNALLLASLCGGWGEWTLAEMHLRCAAQLLGQAGDWDMLINFSGASVPLLSAEAMRVVLRRHAASQTSIVQTYAISIQRDTEPFVDRTRQVLPRLPGAKDWMLGVGSQWTALARVLVEQILVAPPPESQWGNTSAVQLNRALRPLACTAAGCVWIRFFHSLQTWSRIADESFWQSICLWLNGGDGHWCDAVADAHPTFTHFEPGEAHPASFEADELRDRFCGPLAELYAQNTSALHVSRIYLFARKVAMNAGSSQRRHLLDRLPCPAGL